MGTLLIMKLQISWQERYLNIRSQDLNQLSASQFELDEQKSKKHSESTTGVKTGKRTYTGFLCQKNEGSAEIKQRPTKMGGRTIYRTLSPKRTPFQTGIDRGPHLAKGA
jgi:hypothetical protein